MATDAKGHVQNGHFGSIGLRYIFEYFSKISTELKIQNVYLKNADGTMDSNFTFKNGFKSCNENREFCLKAFCGTVDPTPPHSNTHKNLLTPSATI